MMGSYTVVASAAAEMVVAVAAVAVAVGISSGCSIFFCERCGGGDDGMGKWEESMEGEVCKNNVGVGVEVGALG